MPRPGPRRGPEVDQLRSDRLALPELLQEPDRPAWFDAQPWPHLSEWLWARLKAPVFAQVMDKYPPWRAGQPGISFPS